MKTLNFQIPVSVLAPMTTPWRAGYGEPAESATGGVLILSTETPCQRAVAQAPIEMLGVNAPPIAEVQFQMESPVVSPGIIEATQANESRLPSLTATRKPGGFSDQSWVVERDVGLMSDTFIQNYLSVTSHEEYVFLVTDKQPS